MAIVVQEEAKKVNWVAVLTVLVVVVVIFASLYFLLFKKPELIEIVVPGRLENLNSLSKVPFDPEGVVNDPAFKVLRRYASPVSKTSTPGKANPFRP